MLRATIRYADAKGNTLTKRVSLSDLPEIARQQLAKASQGIKVVSVQIARG